MRRALGMAGLCCVLAACGSGGDASSRISASPDTSRAARAIDAWCAARQAEVAPAEITAIRGQEERQRARLAKILRATDKNSDLYEFGAKNVKAMLREEGLMLQLPLPDEVSELLRRLHALPADSAARAWGDRLADYRTALFAIDAKFKHGDTQAGSDANDLPEPGDLEAQAAQTGVAACGPMVIDPSGARIYAQLALSDVRSVGTVGDMLDALRRREPWLTARAEPNACALPESGDPAAGEAISSYAVGIWKDADGTVGVTVSGQEDGGTLTRTASGGRWTSFTVSITPAGRFRRVGPCPR